MKNLILRRGEDRRIRAGHLWVFSNEVDVAKSPLKDFEAGESVRVTDSGGRPLGTAYINPASLICARMISRKPDAELNADFLRQRIGHALKLRDGLIGAPYYRLIFGEGDYLPGLVVDRFGDVAAAQITTAGMEAHRDDIASILGEMLGLQSLLWRNDTASRDLEGLPRYVEAAFGTPPDDVELVESGARFIAPFAGGQKTGWFYDQRDNRIAAARLATMNASTGDSRVLDAFCYVGSFGVMAAKAGASAVTFLDASQVALDYAVRNAALNSPECQVDTVQGDAMDTLRALRDQGRKFDTVCIDPPAFIKRRKDAKAGLAAYQKVNELALDLVEDGGMLVSCSCSQHLERAALRRVMAHAASRRKAELQLLFQGHQGPDHPVHPAMLETDYLKCFIARVSKRG
ncbi:MAG: class I SAM-dependent rRNA methyltransferase [Pseudomonadota bacterium]